MAEYIELEALRSKAVYMHGFGKNKYVPLRAIEEAPVADVVPRELLTASEAARADLGRRLAEEMQENQLLPPCKIGDEVWGIRNYKGKKHPQRGRVNEMFYRSDMSLLITVKHVCRGTWGVNVFPTFEAAEAALRGGRDG